MAKSVKKVKKNGKKWVNSKKVTLDGIKFDSTANSFAYQKLKQAGLYGNDKFLYEPKQFEVVEGFIFDGKKYQNIKITPDFVDFNKGVIFEVKGRKTPDWVIRWKLFKRWLSINHPNYKLYVSKSSQKDIISTINEIKTKHY